MKCPRCNTDLKLVAEKQNPRKSRSVAFGKPSAVTLTYRNYYYCPKCDKSFTATINIRGESDNPFNELHEWR